MSSGIGRGCSEPIETLQSRARELEKKVCYPSELVFDLNFKITIFNISCFQLSLLFNQIFIVISVFPFVMVRVCCFHLVLFVNLTLQFSPCLNRLVCIFCCFDMFCEDVASLVD